MDIDKIIQHSRSRFDHAAARRVIKEKYEARMLFAHAGGMWRAGPELQMILLTCPGTEAVILDQYDNPIRVNIKELLELSQQRWQEQMNAWLVEYAQSKSNR